MHTEIFWAISPDRTAHKFWVKYLPGATNKPARIKYGELVGNSALPKETKICKRYNHLPNVLGNQLQHILGYGWTVLTHEQVTKIILNAI